MSDVENKLLEIPSVYGLLKLFPKRAAISDTMSYSVIKSALLSDSLTLQVKRECLRAPLPVLILDGVEDIVHKDFERSEVSFRSVGLDLAGFRGGCLWTTPDAQPLSSP